MNTFQKLYKPLGILSLIFIFMLGTFDAEAQRRRKKRSKRNSDREESVSTYRFKDHLVYEIGFGNFGYGGNNFYNVLSLSLKPTIGYKFNDRFMVGLGGKMYYDYYNFTNSDESINVFSSGALIYGKARAFGNFYGVLEYDYTKFDYVEFGTVLTQSVHSPLVGVEYMSGLGKWKFGFQVLVPLRDEYIDRSPNGIIDYWFQARYNF